MPTFPQPTSTEKAGHRLVVDSPDKILPAPRETLGSPALLYVFEFPPCEATAGPILMARLLKSYPHDKLHVLAGSYFLKRFQSGRLDCHHLSFPQTSDTGRWGLGRLKQLLEMALLPVLAVYCWQVIRRYRIAAVLSVAHNMFFLAAAVAARLARVPFVLVVHDDWIDSMQSRMWVPSAVARWCYRPVLRSAAQIYAVSPGMQQSLRQEYGVESEVQLPASEAQPSSSDPGSAPGTLRVAFAGTVTAVTIPSIDLLVKALQSPVMSGIKWSLDIYGAWPKDVRQLGWDDERIHGNGWASQQQLPAVLRQADVLYLPYSFDDDQLRIVQTSFPSKLADYLAAGRPVLICAPPESGVVPYAREGGFAELVDLPNKDLLAAALVRLATSPEHRQRLAALGLQVFAENHDIVRQRREFIACITRLVQQQGKQRGASPG
jgi:glycosyltransferase involved in cell wall biosynthesis